MMLPLTRSVWLCRFLLQSLEDLDTSLRKLNSRLFVVRGQPADVFPRLFKVSVQGPREDSEILLPRVSLQTERDDLAKEMETAKGWTHHCCWRSWEQTQSVSLPTEWKLC